MSAFARMARIVLLMAACYAGAYAAMHPNRNGSERAQVENRLSGFARAPDDVIRNAAHQLVSWSASPNSGALLPAEPFGFVSAAASYRDFADKWAELQSRMSAEQGVLAACRSDAAKCPKPAIQLLSIVEAGRKQKGRARIGHINRAVNLAIRPASDWDQYGSADLWASPLQTLASGAGDCEDYAIVKYAALRESGFAARDLRFIIVRDNARQTDHAVVAVRDADGWLVLDNRTMAILNAENVQNYQPLLSLQQQDVRRMAAVTLDAPIDR
ncbi:MAG TPA: transglutaminase-like cysteine peptidase [Pseudolabrys sp.]|nr:transglutaminase-like cysteine peptidase [Pseudolabrys sp.]